MKSFLFLMSLFVLSFDSAAAAAPGDSTSAHLGDFAVLGPCSVLFPPPASGQIFDGVIVNTDTAVSYWVEWDNGILVLMSGQSIELSGRIKYIGPKRSPEALYRDGVKRLADFGRVIFLNPAEEERLWREAREVVVDKHARRKLATERGWRVRK